LDKHVDDLIAFDMSGLKKPDLGVFHYALQRSGAIPEKSLFIGDSLRRDIAPAKEIGMITAYAAYGDRNETDRAFSFEPDYKLNHISEVLQIVRERNRSTT
jgi:putative hydrolase of the HAD superfamily